MTARCPRRDPYDTRDNRGAHSATRNSSEPTTCNTDSLSSSKHSTRHLSVGL